MAAVTDRRYRHSSCQHQQQRQYQDVANNNHVSPAIHRSSHASRKTSVGRVPLEIGNLTMAKRLYLPENHFEVEIPSEVRNLRNLEVLDMGMNRIDGAIAFDIFNITTIRIIDFTTNKLLGHLPSNIGLFLLNLQKIFLLGNELSGTIPSSISNVSQLNYLELAHNSFSGFIPKTLGNLRLLQWLNLGYNKLTVESTAPSNVLLDEDMVAHVADFGIAKLLGDGDSVTWTMTLATTGYMAPEFSCLILPHMMSSNVTCRVWIRRTVSTRGDMYSFGIFLMETFTRKRPTDDMFIGEMSLKHWVDVSFPHSVIDIIDPNLMGNERDEDAVKECISSLMGLAMGCCAESPEHRTNIVNVSTILNKIKLKLLKDIG
ncbi:hypothetical protein CJ030_MR3G025346 [Morella rubra]|uniref:Protein kinase domain-containing protein n=1 Tax=Morella rubra TaxID=262757 RepID=A0A6A1W7S8_9ROSI|nr:hypothetical protein CJ030_MR3G025346 [Morella rubra]